jgi:hypothetical protein
VGLPVCHRLDVARSRPDADLRDRALLVLGAALLSLPPAGRIDYAILDLSLFRIPTFRYAIAGATLFRVGVGATPFLLPLLLQVGFGMTPFQSGMVIRPRLRAPA